MDLGEVASSGISMTTLEEVFMALGEQALKVGYATPKRSFGNREIRVAHRSHLCMFICFICQVYTCRCVDTDVMHSWHLSPFGRCQCVSIRTLGDMLLVGVSCSEGEK